MLVPGEGEQLAVAFINAVLLSLWAALPLLVIGYIRQVMASRAMVAEFSLRKSEVVELERALTLYEGVCRRLHELEPQPEVPVGFWGTLFARPVERAAAQIEELEDLRAHAQHLRDTIIQLKRRPLQRLRSWVHAVSMRCALGRAVAVHVVGFALLVAAFHMPGQVAFADELQSDSGNVLVWYPLDERLFYANAVAAGFATIAASIFYVLRRVGLRHQYGLEFCVFTDLAESDPVRGLELAHMDQSQAQAGLEYESAAKQIAADGGSVDWVSVLGVSTAPTLDEVKEAYKALIKQNHPDRVHGMAPAFKELAEAQTKRINAAYQQALSAQQPLLESEGDTAAA